MKKINVFLLLLTFFTITNNCFAQESNDIDKTGIILNVEIYEMVHNNEGFSLTNLVCKPSFSALINEKTNLFIGERLTNNKDIGLNINVKPTNLNEKENTVNLEFNINYSSIKNIINKDVNEYEFNNNNLLIPINESKSIIVLLKNKNDKNDCKYYEVYISAKAKKHFLFEDYYKVTYN